MKNEGQPAGLAAFKAIARWVVPFNIYLALIESKRERLAQVEPQSPVPPPALAPNAALKDRHKGERCFIVANGPSVLNQDLTRLRGETVFSVSNGYLHRGFEAMKPHYHVIPQLTFGTFTKRDAIAWFKEMHARIGDSELFLSLSDEQLIHANGLFAGRTVRYLSLSESSDRWSDRSIVDISRPVPAVQSVPVMAMMIAMYMGFREIYLLGVDLDHFKTGMYGYAFEPTVLKGKDYTVAPDGRITLSRHDDFQALAMLWRQYRLLREIAESNGVRIFNATAGGELDEFPRIKLEDVVGR